MPTKDIATFERREPLEKTKSELAVQIPLTIANGFKTAQGDVLGVITTSGFGRKRSRAVAAGAGFTTASPSGVVDDASVFAAGDTLKNSTGTTVGTVAAGGVNTATNTITLTANAAVAVPAGQAVLASDGSQVAVAIAGEGSDGDGATPTRIFIAGVLKQSKLRGLDQTAKTELVGRSVPGDYFIF